MGRDQHGIRDDGRVRGVRHPGRRRRVRPLEDELLQQPELLPPPRGKPHGDEELVAAGAATLVVELASLFNFQRFRNFKLAYLRVGILLRDVLALICV